MPNFADIAAKKVEDVKAPPLPPVGTYQWRIMKLAESQKSQDEKWVFLRITCKVVNALDDVDLEGYEGDPNNIMMSHSFVFNCEDPVEFDKTLYRLTQFFKDHVRCVEDGMSVAEMINASVNGEFLGTIKWKQDKRDESGETFQAEIGKTAPVE